MHISLSAAQPRVAPVRVGTVRTPQQSESTTVDVVDLNTKSVSDLTVGERKLGWAQKGASAAVAVFNTLATVGAGVALGALGGATLGLPGAIAGAALGLAGGLAGPVLGERLGTEKPFLPFKKAAAQLGAQVGSALSAPLQKLFPNSIKEFQLTDAVKTEIISETEQAEFQSRLQPGDILLTMSNNDPFFHGLVSMKKSASQHSHVALYVGDGQLVEASAATGQVGSRDATAALAGKSHLMAIRPEYQDGNAQAVVAQAKNYIGRRYDWLASLSDKRLGCVELPYHSLQKAAPEHEVPVTNVMGLRKFIFPSDFVNTSQSTIVASAGVRRDASSMRLARYADIAQEAIQG